MENIRNYETNSKPQFINFCENYKSNKDQANNEKPYENAYEIELLELGFFKVFCVTDK